jgi:hypothetical protein
MMMGIPLSDSEQPVLAKASPASVEGGEPREEKEPQSLNESLNDIESLQKEAPLDDIEMSKFQSDA